MSIDVDKVPLYEVDVSVTPGGKPIELVEDRFKAVGEYAEDAINAITDQADGLLTQLTRVLDNWVQPPPTTVNYTQYTATVLDLLSRLASYRPERPDSLEPERVDAPAEPTFVDVPTVDVSDMPEFTAVLQPVVWHEPPEDDFPEDPGDPESIQRPGSVEKPVFTWPAEPSLPDVAIPEMPSGLLTPEFTGVRPSTVELDPPVTAFTHTEQAYSSNLAEAMKDYLLDVVANGSDGLGADVREAIYDRAAEKLREEWDDEYTRVLKSNRGFRVPAGPTVARLDAVNYKYLRALADLNDQITIQDAERAFQNRQFCVERGVAYESALMQAYNETATRTFAIAQFTFQSVTEIFNRQVQAYQAKLAGYQADAAVYEGLIRGANLLLERYRLELDGAKLRGDLRQQDVALYTALLEARRTLAAVYTAQVDAQKAEAEVERLLLDAFKARVDIWATKINALTAKWNLHNAKLAGEQQKIDLYGKQVDAYTAQVNALRSEAEVERIKVESATAKNNSSVQIYQARVQKYQADLSQAIERVKALVSAYGVDIDEFKAWIQAAVEQQRAYTEQYQGDVQQSRNQTELELKAAEVNLQALLARLNVETEVVKSKTSVMAQIAASALGAVNATASAGYSSNWGLSENISKSMSLSNSASISESTSVSE